VLSLAAARLGSGKVLAVDKNGLAAKTALRNVRLNELSDRVLVVRGAAEDFMDYSADLVIANVHYDVMRHLIRSQRFYNKKWYILSGLLRSEAKEVSSQLPGLPVELKKSWAEDGIWHTFCFEFL